MCVSPHFFEISNLNINSVEKTLEFFFVVNFFLSLVETDFLSNFKQSWAAIQFYSQKNVLFKNLYKKRLFFTFNGQTVFQIVRNLFWFAFFFVLKLIAIYFLLIAVLFHGHLLLFASVKFSRSQNSVYSNSVSKRKYQIESKFIFVVCESGTRFLVQRSNETNFQTCRTIQFIIICVVYVRCVFTHLPLNTTVHRLWVCVNICVSSFSVLDTNIPKQQKVWTTHRMCVCVSLYI